MTAAYDICALPHGVRAASALFYKHARITPYRLKQENEMLQWAIFFFIFALIAAVFGFTGIAAASAGIAQVIFYVFLAIFLVTLAMGLINRGR